MLYILGVSIVDIEARDVSMGIYEYIWVYMGIYDCTYGGKHEFMKSYEEKV